MLLRRLVSQIALLIGIATLLFVLSIAGVYGSDATNGDGSGTPAALETSLSSNDEDQGTTGQTELGSSEDLPSPTPTPAPATTTDDEAGAPLETVLGDGGDTSTGAQTGESDSLIQETAESEETDGVETAEEPVLHPLVVTIFNCETDPGAALPQDHPDCSTAEAANVSVQVDSIAIGSQPTDGNGQATFSIEEGSTAVVSQDPATVPTGFTPRGAVPVEVLVEGPAVAQIVNVADAEEVVETQGRFQIASGQCFTGLEPYTEIMIVGPMVRAAAQECGPLAGAEFTITGGSLAEPLGLTTDGSGNWTGSLDAGDYIIARAGASAGFSIVLDQITVAVAVDWIAGPTGAVGVQRYVCSEGDRNGTVISLIEGGGGGPPNASCVASDANVQLYASGSAAKPLNLPGNGTQVPVAAGDYTVRDVTSGAGRALTVTEGGFVQALIVETRLAGVVAAQLNLCADPSSNFEDPTQPGYWSGNCGPAAPGLYVALLDTTGTVVASTETGGDGTANFEDILAGTYLLDVESSCALFANGADARAGFAVGPNQVVTLAAYECATPSNPNPPPGGGDNGGEDDQAGGTPDPNGNGIGSVGSMPDQLFNIGDTLPEVAPAQNPKLFVTTLPSTGTGQAAASSLWAAILLLTAITCLVAIRMATLAEQASPARSRR